MKQRESNLMASRRKKSVVREPVIVSASDVVLKRVSASVIVIIVVAFLSLRGAQAQDKKHEFDGEWVGRASSQNSDNCRPGTYQITVKDSQLAGTYDVRVKIRGNYRTIPAR